MKAFDITIKYQFQDKIFTILPGLSDDKKSSIFYVFDDTNQVGILSLFDIINWHDITNTMNEDLIYLISKEIESYYL